MYIHLIVFLSNGDIGDDEWGLHFGLVEQLFLSSCFLKALEDEWTRNRAKDEHIEEDIKDEHAVVPVVLLYRR